MFELSVALKYLIPRWRQLSVSIISMISVLVIALVVWLILVFFSVTLGLEKTWINKLISLTAPVRVTPTEAYYKSFYYLSDGISAQADYSLKTIAEKRLSGVNYDPEVDEEPPADWILPDQDSAGETKDLIALAFEKIEGLQLQATDFVMSVGNVHLKQQGRKNLSQGTYLGSLDPRNKQLVESILPIPVDDLASLYLQLDKEQLERFFAHVNISALKTPEKGWKIPRHLFPKEGNFKAYVSKGRDWVLLPHELKEPSEQFDLVDLKMYGAELYAQNQHLDPLTPVYLDGNIRMAAKAQLEEGLTSPEEIPYKVRFTLQNQEFEGVVPYRGLEFAAADAVTSFQSQPDKIPLWGYAYAFPDGSKEYILPKDPVMGDGVLLPKTYRTLQTKLGDRGFLTYYSPTPSTVQEMRVPVYVAGFYDPGIIPIGGKYIVTSKEIATLFHVAHNIVDPLLINGINVSFEPLERADAVKEALTKSFKEAGIAPYFKIETYREYEFTRDLIQQLHSEKNLFTLIATVIIIVACSNIISMLIILVNDKKMEIGILRSMGASALSIASIFGVCGMLMGLIGSVIGTIAALLTLNHLQTLIAWISWAQGYEMFNPLFYGEVMPSEISGEALAFVFLATVIISLVAGIVPAVKASLLRPSTTLRAE